MFQVGTSEITEISFQSVGHVDGTLGALNSIPARGGGGTLF